MFIAPSCFFLEFRYSSSQCYKKTFGFTLLKFIPRNFRLIEDVKGSQPKESEIEAQQLNSFQKKLRNFKPLDIQPLIASSLPPRTDRSFWSSFDEDDRLLLMPHENNWKSILTVRYKTRIKARVFKVRNRESVIT